MDEKHISPRVRSGAHGSGEKKKSSKKKQHSLAFLVIKKLFAVIATTLLSLFMVIIITSTVVCTALTVYVLDFMDESTNITMQDLESASTTYFYANQTNEQGEKELVVIHDVTPSFQRIPVSIDRVPQHVRDCFVCTEDENFYAHDGVDYKRTFSAFVNLFINIYDTEQGGSTITQQLVKNLTKDDEHTPQRKIREIFSAMQLEKSYTKDEILAEYLNVIAFGGPINGIQLASLRYFGKNVEELTIPEASVLAAVPKSPEFYGALVEYYDDDTHKQIVDGRANNRPRQEYVLSKLYENGAITYDEYQKYLDTKLIYTDSPEYLAKHPEKQAQELEEKQKIYSWALDAIYYEAADFFMKEYNLDLDEAYTKINSGGYKIYSCIDDKMQKYVEEKFLDATNLISLDATRRWWDRDGDGKTEEYLPHVAFCAINYQGEVLAAVGDTGEKEHSLVTNFAVQEKRQVGSTMKPVAAYGYALDRDEIHWGTFFKDAPIKYENGKPWPTNYGNTLSYGTYPVVTLLQQSFNTAPAQIVNNAGESEIYNFCKKQLGMKLALQDEISNSALSLGSLTEGITLENLVNAYLPYGNKGIYNEAHVITKIEDSNQKVIYENNGNPRQAVSDETAWVMNRL
ncbi:MAG: transglycosylase domain-containing protein, partial [Ruminococcus sp.]|nr:transglycosylase domain-containing protein [Ruminococcus sp.]